MITTINEFKEYKSNIANRAYAELCLIGMLDGDYNQAAAKCILDLCELFGLQGHSGLSAEYVLDLFTLLAKNKAVSDLTNNPIVWNDVSHYSDDKPDTIWQNKRDSAVFSYDMGKTWKSVNEKKILFIVESVISRKKDVDIFNYKSQIIDLWRSIIKEAQDFQHINFDLENNDTTGQKKTIFVTKNLRKEQPVKYEINAELFKACGDWESPVMYFKLEFTHDYNIMSYGNKLIKPEYVWDLKRDNTKMSKMFVIIPDNENGNHLDKTEKGFTASDGNDKTKNITDKDEKTAWKWIVSLLEKLVDDRHKMIVDNSNSEISEPESVRSIKYKNDGG